MEPTIQEGSKQVAVATRWGKGENQVIVFNAVDEQPVVPDMAFPVPAPPAGKVMVSWGANSFNVISLTEDRPPSMGTRVGGRGTRERATGSDRIGVGGNVVHEYGKVALDSGHSRAPPGIVDVDDLIGRARFCEAVDLGEKAVVDPHDVGNPFLFQRLYQPDRRKAPISVNTNCMTSRALNFRFRVNAVSWVLYYSQLNLETSQREIFSQCMEPE
jgi:hypothetical protein